MRQFEFLDLFNRLERDDSFQTKRMFGCLALYFAGLCVAVLAEDPGEKSYRGKKYPYDIWYGIMWPTSREHHSSLLEKFPELKPHPVLGKWLYLPSNSESFEEVTDKLIRLIVKGDPRMGIIPGLKKKKKKARTR